jgi:hypothetical protein
MTLCPTITTLDHRSWPQEVLEATNTVLIEPCRAQPYTNICHLCQPACTCNGDRILLDCHCQCRQWCQGLHTDASHEALQPKSNSCQCQLDPGCTGGSANASAKKVTVLGLCRPMPVSAAANQSWSVQAAASRTDIHINMHIAAPTYQQTV